MAELIFLKLSSKLEDMICYDSRTTILKSFEIFELTESP